MAPIFFVVYHCTVLKNWKNSPLLKSLWTIRKKTPMILAFEANKAVWLPQILLFFGFCNTVVLIQSFPIFAARMFFLINHTMPISDVSGTWHRISGYPDSGFSQKNGFKMQAKQGFSSFYANVLPYLSTIENHQICQKFGQLA